MGLFEVFIEYREQFTNYKQVLTHMLLRKYPIRINRRNGHLQTVFNHKQLELSRSGFEFSYDPDKQLMIFNFEGKELKLTDADYNGDLRGVFWYQEYKSLDVKNHSIIDIGANIGDSAIYFVLKGAERVIALEPYPLTYQTFIKNIKLMKLENKIEPINAGYGQDSVVLVDKTKRAISSTSLVQSKNGGEPIRLYSIKTLLATYDLNNAILKMDCEGCEYQILNEDPKVITSFEQIMLEYHYGYEQIVDYLKNLGYSVTFTDPIKSYNANAENPNMVTGMIFAVRSRSN